MSSGDDDVEVEELRPPSSSDVTTAPFDSWYGAEPPVCTHSSTCTSIPTHGEPHHHVPVVCSLHADPTRHISLYQPTCQHPGCKESPWYHPVPRTPQTMYSLRRGTLCWTHALELMKQQQQQVVHRTPTKIIPYCLYPTCTQRACYHYTTMLPPFPIYCANHRESASTLTPSTPTTTVYGIPKAGTGATTIREPMMYLLPECAFCTLYSMDKPPPTRKVPLSELCGHCRSMYPSCILYRIKKKERMVIEHLIHHLPHLPYQFGVSVHIRSSQTYMYPDICIVLERHIVHVEIDEHQHSTPSYSPHKEQERIQHFAEEYMRRYAKPLVVVRFNPDTYRVHGVTTTISMHERLKTLVHIVRTVTDSTYRVHTFSTLSTPDKEQQQQLPSPDVHPEVIHLYFDEPLHTWRTQPIVKREFEECT